MFGIDLPKNPLTLIRKMSPNAKAVTRVALDVVENASVITLRNVPGVFMAVMREAGEAHNVPAELLAAIAAGITKFDVGFSIGERRGLMGLYDGQPGSVVADEDMLCSTEEDGDGNRVPTADAREQATAVRANIDGAARELARLYAKFPREGWAGVIDRYCGDYSAAVLGAFMLYMLRGADMKADGPLKMIREALEG